MKTRRVTSRLTSPRPDLLFGGRGQIALNPADRAKADLTSPTYLREFGGCVWRITKPKTDLPTSPVLRTGSSVGEVACTSTATNLVRRLSYNNVDVSKEHEHQPVCDLRDAIASTLQTENPNDQPSVLNAWITIAEYATLDGSRFLITRSGGSKGSDHITTPWQRRGMLHEVLDTGLVDDEFDIVFDSDADDDIEEDA